MSEFGLTKKVIGCAMEVHKELGPGLLENTYKHCLAHEFRNTGIQFEMEKEIPVHYKGLRIEAGFRLDFIVERQLIIELKSVSNLLAVHEAQILTYMKLTRIELGLLINFNAYLLKQGIKRYVL